MCNKLHAEGFMPVTSKVGLKLFAKDESGEFQAFKGSIPNRFPAKAPVQQATNQSTYAPDGGSLSGSGDAGEN